MAFCSFGIAQNGKKSTKTLSTKKIKVADSIKVTKIAEELPSTVVAFTLKDTTVFNLEDIAIAREKDSLWLKELYKSDLFDDIYNSVADQNFEEVDYDELPTEVLKQRLKELDARTPFKVEYSASLESVIKQYLKNRRGTLERLMGLSEYYFPMFEAELDKNNLPLELKYLAVIESALNPSARSRVGATGLWQFMFATGKMFGLDVSSYVDERSDPIRATEAACKYLNSLNNSFNDWNLALAAYNSGPGNVSKAIRRSGGKTDYWDLRKYLPRETAGYVPAFLATMYIFEYAKEHGFQKHTSSRIPYVATDTIRVKKQITLEQVAELTNLDMEELEFLNPSYKLGIIPVIKNEDYVLRLPITAIGSFVANEDAIYTFVQQEQEEAEKPAPELYDQPAKIRYRVKSGDFLGRIAEKYGVGVSQIKEWNGMRNSNVRVGQNLIIYPRKTGQDIASNAELKTSSSENIYTVRNGDSLWSISQKFPGVSVQNIKNWNDISGTNIKPGTKLKIYKG